MNTQNIDTRYEALIAAIAEKADADEKFMQGLISANSPEDIRSYLVGNGIDATAEDVSRFLDEGKMALEEASQNEELSELDLESVAGGGKWRGLARQFATYAAVAGIGIGMVALCAALPEAAPAWIAIGKAGMVTAGAMGTVWTLKGYAK